MEIIGIPALAFAVGVYLPLEATTPVFLGGLARRLVDWKRHSDAESDAGPGVLYSSGLVAGGSIMGLMVAFTALHPRVEKVAEMLGAPGIWLQQAAGPGFMSFVGFALFLGVAYLIYRTALRAGTGEPAGPVIEKM
jgi:hypothetical protein